MNKDVYPLNGFVIRDREGFRAFQYDETVKSLSRRGDKRVKDKKFLDQLEIKIFGANWNKR